MADAAAPTEKSLREFHGGIHLDCFACRPAERGGLGLVFTLQPDGSVVADWLPPAGSESYPGVLHGGLIATALDSAMVHALFARGICAKTGELTVRYRESIRIGLKVRVTGRLLKSYGPLFYMEAEVSQDARICATAHAKFMDSNIPAPGAAVR